MLIGFIEKHESLADPPIGSSFIHTSLIHLDFLFVLFKLDMFGFPILQSKVLVLVPALIGFIEKHDFLADRPIGSSFIHTPLILLDFLFVLLKLDMFGFPIFQN